MGGFGAVKRLSCGKVALCAVEYRKRPPSKKGDRACKTTAWGERSSRCAEAHHLSSRDLADRCGLDLALIEGLEAGGGCPRRSRRSSRSRARWRAPRHAHGRRRGSGTRLHRPRPDGRGRARRQPRGPPRAATSAIQLGAGRPSRHMDPFVITVDPTGETRPRARGPRGRGMAVRHGGLHRDRVRQGRLRAASRREHLLRLHRCRTRCAPTTARRRSSWPWSIPRSDDRSTDLTLRLAAVPDLRAIAGMPCLGFVDQGAPARSRSA